jgi:hypothetical protein
MESAPGAWVYRRASPAECETQNACAIESTTLPRVESPAFEELQLRRIFPNPSQYEQASAARNMLSPLHTAVILRALRPEGPINPKHLSGSLSFRTRFHLLSFRAGVSPAQSALAFIYRCHPEGLQARRTPAIQSNSPAPCHSKRAFIFCYSEGSRQRL